MSRTPRLMLPFSVSAPARCPLPALGNFITCKTPPFQASPRAAHVGRSVTNSTLLNLTNIPLILPFVASATTKRPKKGKNLTFRKLLIMRSLRFPYVFRFSRSYPSTALKVSFKGPGGMLQRRRNALPATDFRAKNAQKAAKPTSFSTFPSSQEAVHNHFAWFEQLVQLS